MLSSLMRLIIPIGRYRGSSSVSASLLLTSSLLGIAFNEMDMIWRLTRGKPFFESNREQLNLNFQFANKRRRRCKRRWSTNYEDKF